MIRHTLLPCLCLLGACTAFVPDGRRTTTWLDEHATPESATARICLAPVAVPVGLASLVVDTVLVNPVCAIDDAWGDTVEALWESREESSLRRALFTPLAALATPVVFTFDWGWRCLFPIDPREPSEADR